MKTVYVIETKMLGGELKILGVYASRKTAEGDVAEFRRQQPKADFTIKQYSVIE